MVKRTFSTMVFGVLLVSSYGVFGQECPKPCPAPCPKPVATCPAPAPSCPLPDTCPAPEPNPCGDHSKMELKGNITAITCNSITVHSYVDCTDTLVYLTDDSCVNGVTSRPTKIKMVNRGLLKGSEHTDRGKLLLGLYVHVEGRNDGNGNLVAHEISYNKSDWRAMTQTDARANALNGQLTGQIDQTAGVAKSALDNAQTAQSAANAAQSAANTAQASADQVRAIAVSNQQFIGNLDDFVAVGSLTVQFDVNSAHLTPEAKSQLDAFVAKIGADSSGYILQISGFASSEGDLKHNRVLSDARANSVQEYLVSYGKIEPRRIINVFPGGITQPVANNDTLSGREANRRATVTVYINKALAKGPVTSIQP